MAWRKGFATTLLCERSMDWSVGKIRVPLLAIQREMLTVLTHPTTAAYSKWPSMASRRPGAPSQFHITPGAGLGVDGSGSCSHLIDKTRHRRAGVDTGRAGMAQWGYLGLG